MRTRRFTCGALDDCHGFRAARRDINAAATQEISKVALTLRDQALLIRALGDVHGHRQPSLGRESRHCGVQRVAHRVGCVRRYTDLYEIGGALQH